MNLKVRGVAYLVLIALPLFVFRCTVVAEKEMDVSPLEGARDLSEAFLKYYEPVSEDFEVEMLEYQLPLNPRRVTNFRDVESEYLKTPLDRELLLQNGFVVVDGGTVDDIATPYERLKEQGIPIYVTVDTPLHLFHIQFDETLKEIEEGFFYRDIVAVTRLLLDASMDDYRSFNGDLKEAAKRNVAYFAVALRQLDPEFDRPSYVGDWVDWECEQIDAHSGLPDYETARDRSLFRVPEDYSQYKPRGHYTRSDLLRRYFRAMMWYGRMTFLLKGHEEFGEIIPPSEALTDRKTARIQTIQAALLSSRSGQTRLADGRRVSDVWDRIYSVTAFYSGFADDLSLYDYRRAMREVFGNRFEANELEDEEKLAEFLFVLAKSREPGIFSGTGGAGVDPGGYEGHEFTSVKDLDKILGHTMGLRFMGQRYIPDSYILGRLVSPAAGTVPRVIPERFTVVYIPDERIQPDRAYSIRGFPRGLDVFSVLGSERAERLIADAKDNEYPRYAEQLEQLRSEFAQLEIGDWNRNLYWSWLYALRTITDTRGSGYQSYQQTEAWLDRQLNTALASWAALRHNTILYAKQSYTPRHLGIESVDPEVTLPPPPKGLVEPLPYFYARILSTARMAREGLKDLGVLSPTSEARLTSLVSTLGGLLEICGRQVRNEPLTADDNAYLANLPEALKESIGEVDERGLKTTIVADVHTDINTRLCLEEASGYVDIIVVAYRRAEGDIVLAVGPVLSYYEFKHSMSDRLTDERWRELLESDDSPARPDWVASFSSP